MNKSLSTLAFCVISVLAQQTSAQEIPVVAADQPAIPPGTEATAGIGTAGIALGLVMVGVVAAAAGGGGSDGGAPTPGTAVNEAGTIAGPGGTGAQ